MGKSICTYVIYRSDTREFFNCEKEEWAMSPWTCEPGPVYESTLKRDFPGIPAHYVKLVPEKELPKREVKNVP